MSAKQRRRDMPQRKKRPSPVSRPTPIRIILDINMKSHLGSYLEAVDKIDDASETDIVMEVHPDGHIELSADILGVVVSAVIKK